MRLLTTVGVPVVVAAVVVVVVRGVLTAVRRRRRACVFAANIFRYQWPRVAQASGGYRALHRNHREKT